MPIYIPLTLDDLGEIDWDGKEFTILCLDGFAGEINVGNMQVDQDSGAGQVINDAVYERNLLFYKEKTRICRGVRHILVMVTHPGNRNSAQARSQSAPRKTQVITCLRIEGFN